MRKIPLALCALAAAAALPMLTANTPQADIRAETLAKIDALDEKGQKIAKIYLKDRVAGEPVSCIPQVRLRRSTAASDEVLLYDDGATVYVNAPYLGCPGARNNTMISSTPIGRLCSGDIVQVQDLLARAPLGSCALSQFIPFRRVKSGG